MYLPYPKVVSTTLVPFRDLATTFILDLTYNQTRRVLGCSMSLREMHLLIATLKRVYDASNAPRQYPLPLSLFISVNDITISCLIVLVWWFRWGALRVPYGKGHSVSAKRAQRTRRHAAFAGLGEGNH